MPLPLGHAFIGLTTQNISSQDNAVFKQWKLTLLVIILANLPDIDVLIGLIFCGNGNAIHRGPTHSLLFALVMGYLISKAWRPFPIIPKIKFLNSFLLILSHVLADRFFTHYPVSLCWPFENIFSIGHAGWGDVLSSVFLENVRDAGIILGCIFMILTNLLIRYSYRGAKALMERSKVMAPVAVKSYKDTQKS